MSVVNRKTLRQDTDPADVLPAGKFHPNDGLVVSRYFRWKDTVDRVAAALLLIIGLPIIALLVLLVRLTSRGPGIYRQTRVGKDGKTFLMYKIRTMRQDAEAGTGAVWTEEKDPRVTLVGRVLRNLHLDEFPQLLNVLKGEMSLIGPRPERPEFVYVLDEEIPGYLDRLAIRPGVTGLAQINLPPDTDLESVRRKLVLDREYIEHGGLLLDARMLLCTFIRLLGFSGDLAMRLMRLDRSIPTSDADPSADTLVIPADMSSCVADTRIDGNGTVSPNRKAHHSRARKSGEPESAVIRNPR